MKTLEGALALISKSAVLPVEGFAALAGMKTELEQNWRTTQVFRTRADLEVSVLNKIKHPTADAEYWQCVREMDTHMHELVMSSYEYRKLVVEIAMIARDAEKEQDSLKRDMMQIEIEKREFIGANIQRQAADRIREIQTLSAMKSERLPLLKYGTEDVGAHKLEAYELRFAREASMVNQNTPPADAINLIGKAETVKARAPFIRSLSGETVTSIEDMLNG